MTFGEAAPWPTHSESDCTILMQKHQHYNTVKWNVQPLSLITFWSHYPFRIRLYYTNAKASTL